MADIYDIKWLIPIMYGIIIILGGIVVAVIYYEVRKWRKGGK